MYYAIDYNILTLCLLSVTSLAGAVTTAYNDVFVCYSFVMSDTLCPLYKVSLTKNHLPLESSTGIGVMLPLKPLSAKGTNQDDQLQHKPQGVQQGPRRPIGRGRGILCLNAEDIRKPH